MIRYGWIHRADSQMRARYYRNATPLIRLKWTMRIPNRRNECPSQIQTGAAITPEARSKRDHSTKRKEDRSSRTKQLDNCRLLMNTISNPPLLSHTKLYEKYRARMLIHASSFKFRRLFYLTHGDFHLRHEMIFSYCTFWSVEHILEQRCFTNNMKRLL